eukprot:scaffold5190_cov92-Skeletonema_dohrnii-CCMP3373.AAC.5
MSKVKTLDSGGFFFEANPRLENIDVSGLNELGELTYFIIRHSPNLRQGGLNIGGDLSHSENVPLLSNLQCNAPDFCVEPQVPEWLRPVCQNSSSDHISMRISAPQSQLFPRRCVTRVPLAPMHTTYGQGRTTMILRKIQSRSAVLHNILQSNGRGTSVMCENEQEMNVI